MVLPIVFRRKNQEFDLKQVQESELSAENEVSSEDNIYSNMDKSIALKKRGGTRECTKCPLYPISIFISLEKCFHFTKSFLLV